MKLQQQLLAAAYTTTASNLRVGNYLTFKNWQLNEKLLISQHLQVLVHKQLNVITFTHLKQHYTQTNDFTSI